MRYIILGIVITLVLIVSYFYKPVSYAQQKGQSMKLSSMSFKHNSPLALRFTKYGNNISPHLKWENLPENTKSLALIIDDPDAPTPKPFVHVLAFDIDPQLMELPEGALNNAQNIIYGKNDFGNLDYDGPKPPAGKPHRYFFKLYALDIPLALRPGINKKELEGAMQGHIVASAEIIGTYQA